MSEGFERFRDYQAKRPEASQNSTLSNGSLFARKEDGKFAMQIEDTASAPPTRRHSLWWRSFLRPPLWPPATCPQDEPPAWIP